MARRKIIYDAVGAYNPFSENPHAELMRAIQ